MRKKHRCSAVLRHAYIGFDRSLSFQDGNHTLVTVNRYPLPAFDPLGGITNSQNSGDAILARNDGPMSQYTADIRHQPRRVRKQLRPGRGGQGTYQNRVRGHLVKIVWCHDDAGDPGNRSR